MRILDRSWSENVLVAVQSVSDCLTWTPEDGQSDLTWARCRLEPPTEPPEALSDEAERIELLGAGAVSGHQAGGRYLRNSPYLRDHNVSWE